MFWNVAGKEDVHLLAIACRDYAIDVMILAEIKSNETEILSGLTLKGLHNFEEVKVVGSRVRFFARANNDINVLYEGSHFSIISIKPQSGKEIILAGCHLRSKLHSEESDQYFQARLLSTKIQHAEGSRGHQLSMIIGDLNMNPFEPAMNAADGLHAVMDKRIALGIYRTVQETRFDFFYNPMWSRMGDDSAGPAGTYYHNSGGKMIAYYWNTFDQVLLRPGLLEFYNQKNLTVVSELAGSTLIKKGRIDSRFSDHLPLVVQLNTENNDGQ